MFAIIISIILILVLCGIYGWVEEAFIIPHYLSKDSRYTIAVSSKQIPGRKYGHISFEYKFFVNKKTYYGRTTDPKYDLTRHNCFVQFYPEKPSYNKLVNEVATQKDIDSLPLDGYKVLPHN